MITKKDRGILDYISQDVASLKEKRWIKPAMAAYLRSKNGNLTYKESIQVVTEYFAELYEKEG